MSTTTAETATTAFTGPTVGTTAPPEPLVAVAQRQGSAVVAILRRTDPQAWLFAERARYQRDGSCDPYAEQLLRRAGFLRD